MSINQSTKSSNNTGESLGKFVCCCMARLDSYNEIMFEEFVNQTRNVAVKDESTENTF